MKRKIITFYNYRNLLLELTKKSIKLKYRNSYLGLFWSLLEPILTSIILGFVFSGYMKGSASEPYVLHILTGRIMYSFFSNSTKQAMGSLHKHSSIIKKIYVPKYIYPVSTTFSCFFSFLITLIVLCCFMLYYRIPFTLHLLQGLLPLSLLLILSTGIGLVLVTISTFIRDIQYIWNTLLLIFMYSGAIIFYYTDPCFIGGLWFYKLNPIFCMIENFRNAVFGRPLNVDFLFISLLYSLGFFLLGTYLFDRKQDKFILYI